MTAPSNFPETQELNALAQAASALGHEIVDIAGFLDLVEAQARDQRIALSGVERGAGNIETASAEVRVAAADLGESVARTAEDVDKSAAHMRSLGKQSVLVATWVQGLHERNCDTLRAVKTNNARIASISMQVNTLATNARIKAARAGEAGRGLAVVAEAINELSRKTKDAAAQISTSIETLTDWIATLGVKAEDIAQPPTTLVKHGAGTDSALGRMQHLSGSHGSGQTGSTPTPARYARGSKSLYRPCTKSAKVSRPRRKASSRRITASTGRSTPLKRWSSPAPP